MRWVALGARLLLGLMFTAAGALYFVPGFAEQKPPDGPARDFGTLLHDSGYLTVVKVLELAGGLMLLTGYFVPLGVTLLVPIAVNIVLFELLLMKQPGPGVVATALLAVLVWHHRRTFGPVLAAKPAAG